MSDEAQTTIRKPADRRCPAVTIPSVRVGAQLGFGGMATVFEGWDDGFNPPRRVAIKLMNTELSADAAFRVRFEREASLVADFRHDNIVHVYASGEAGGIKYIVMEYLGGGTLADKLTQGAMPPAQALATAAALCDALAYSHKRGIVHRDVKPANVLFTADGKPILSDFGVAKASSSTTAQSAALTQQASVVGAPRYMAPEQELGDQVSDRADVYSLGLTLYEMLTGEPPSAAVRLQRIVDEQNHFDELLPSLPKNVTELLHRCLQLDPSARPSAAEFAGHLRSAAASVAAAAIQPRSLKTSHLRIFSLVIAVALLAIAVLLALREQPKVKPEQPARTTAVTPLAIRRLPANATIHVDGKLLTQPSIELARGSHRLVAVAPGHYGQARTLEIPLASGALDITLQPTELPSVAQYQRFLDLADAASINSIERDSVGEQTLRTALDTKLLRQASDPAAARLLDLDLQALATLGDARAAVIGLLAPAIQAGRIAPAAIDDRLMAAADGGDAMASFFAALALRSQVQEATARGESAASEMQAYCSRLQQAAAQGWSEVASGYLQSDGCP